jgi:hypothetical protein
VKCSSAVGESIILLRPPLNRMTRVNSSVRINLAVIAMRSVGMRSDLTDLSRAGIGGLNSDG